MNPQASKQFVIAAWQAFASRDKERIAALFSDDAEWLAPVGNATALAMVAFQERRKRERLRAELSSLSDLELKDITITRGETDYVASNRTIDPARHPIHPSDECLISGTDG